MNLDWRRIWELLGILRPNKLMYIGGSDVLPPPLKPEEEQALLARLGGGGTSRRGSRSSSAICGSSSTSRGALRTLASIWRISSPSGRSGSSRP
jgi:hypothetical protein